MKKLVFFCFFLAIGVFAFGHSVDAVSSTISGTVTYNGSTLIEGMPIYVTDAGTGVYVSSLYTDENGDYSFSLPVGEYMIYAGVESSYIPNVYFIKQVEIVDATAGGAFVQDFDMVRRGRITGHIYQSDGATPIYNAVVYAYNNDGYAKGYGYFTSLVDGTYYLTPLPSDDEQSAAGVYYMYVVKGDYFSRLINDISMPNNGVDYTQDIILTGASYISGKIYNSGSTPVSGATISVSKVGGYLTYSTSTDASGNFLASIYDSNNYNSSAIGNYQVQISAPGYVSYKLNTEITADESTEDVGSIHLTAAGTVNGYVYKSNGTTPIGSATVSANDGYGHTFTTTTSSIGYYEFTSLPASSIYTISATKAGYTYENIYNVKVKKGKTTANKNFTLNRAVTYSGQIKDKSKKAIEGATIYLYSRNKTRSDSYDYMATTDSKGNFTISSIMPGTYRLKVVKSGYIAYKKETVSLKKSASRKVYKLDLASAFYGRITYKGAGVPNVSIYAYGDKKDKDYGYAGTTTDSNGYYRISNLKSGTYKIRFYSTDYVNTGVTKKVKAGVQRTVNIKLTLAGHISGYVYDQNTGMPMQYYTVKVKGTPYSASTDANGYYIIDSLPTGSYQLYIFSSFYEIEFYGGTRTATGSTAVAVQAGKTASDINFYLDQK